MARRICVKQEISRLGTEDASSEIAGHIFGVIKIEI